MGEASRRKKLDSNYGKIPKFASKEGLNLFGMGEIGKNCFEKYGRGILFNVPGDAPKYVLASCSWLKESEKEKIDTYNPSEQILIAELMDTKNSGSRIVGEVSITKANQLRVVSSLTNIEELVSQMLVATAENEPK